MKHKKLSISIFVILLAIVFLLVVFIVDYSKPNIRYGVTFSQPYATNDLKLDWREAYTAILDDLGVSHIRLSAYWNYIESDKDKYNFKDLDWQINEAGKRKVKIVLAVGRRLPRWPECHDPGWIKNLSEKEIQKQQLEFIKAIITRYKNNKNIVYWQIENEPFLTLFGECPKPDKEFLAQEITLVRQLSSKPIMLTDSGELSTWVRVGQTDKDILGTTLYRIVHSQLTGYWRYPIPASYYYFKSVLHNLIFKSQRVVVSELQTEAWHKENTNLPEMTLEEQFESMSIDQFKRNIRFAQKAGFDEIYLWGAEWWYYLKIKRGYDGFWEEAKTLWE